MTLWIAYATTGKELEAEEAIQAMKGCGDDE